MAKKATLINTAGEKKVVESGSQEAQELFGQGFSLDTGETARPQNQSAGNLEGTLGGDDTPNQFDSLKNVIENITRKASTQGPGIQGVLADFKAKIGGKGDISPGTAQEVVGAETERRVGNVSDIFRQTMRGIQTMEETKLTQQTNVNNVMGNLAQLGLLGELSGEEYEQIRQTGILPIEALQKINAGVLRKQEKEPTISEQIALKDAGGRMFEGEAVFGDADPITGAPTDPSKVIGGYNFTSYATDPNWGNKVNNIVNNLPKFNFDTETLPDENGITNLGAKEIDQYIKSINPNSEITGQDVIEVAEANGIPPELMLSILQIESKFGASNVAKQNNNFGGVTWNENYPPEMKGTARPLSEGGNYVKFATPKDGLDAIAFNIKRREGAIPGATGNIEDLNPQQKSEAALLAKQVYGTIRTADQIEQFLVPIQQRMANGESIDNIGDSLRFAGQSPEFMGIIRTAVNQITSDWTDKKTQTAMDKLDDLVVNKDITGTQDYLKKLTLDDSGIEETRTTMGKERTIEFIEEIWDDLQNYENAGGDTNIFSGNIEKLAAKVGTVKDPELRKIATKIAISTQNYRRAMSGAQFSVPESEEYKSIFPQIDKTAVFNKEAFDALKSAFIGDIDFFYGHKMGHDVYNEIFKASTEVGDNMSGTTSSGLNYTITE